MSQASTAIPKGGRGEAVRRSRRHFVPRPTKPGIGRPASGRGVARPTVGGGRT